MSAKRRQSVQQAILEAVLLGLLVLWIYPFITIVLNSFKTTRGMMKDFLSIPAAFRVDNYLYAWQKMDFPRAVMNTVIVTAVGVGGIVLFGSMAAYKLARVHTRMSQLFFTLFLIPMMVPAQTVMLTITKFASWLNLTGSLIGLCIIYWGTQTPFNTFLFHGFVKTVPAELDESARIDGASSLRVFFQIIFPLMTPVIFTSVVLSVITIWNDFLLPLLLLSFNNQKRTITLAVYTAFGTTNIDWPLATAGIVMSITIPIIVFIVLQKYIVDGIVAGAVKS